MNVHDGNIYYKPICRTVEEAVYVLDVIAGFDPRDDEATRERFKFIPEGGYKQFLKNEGLKVKRLGVVRSPFVDKLHDSTITASFEDHLSTLRKRGAIVVDTLHIANIDEILDPHRSGELMEKLAEYGQQTFIEAEESTGISEKEIQVLENLEKLSKDGFEKLMKENDLDVLVTSGSRASPILAIGGYPAILVRRVCDDGMPFGICFGGLRGTESKLVEIAYGFEQATKNPYVKSQDPCGSSTGSAISVAANLAAISLGTETDGSILCPSSSNSVVGIKPTRGLTTEEVSSHRP
ncbi:putative amidase [Camellia lanceoleosa]|uniref:Amidase n=1 Tax=Camellia lanceoleosa TaxID=1840588 RepID=A0ACC0INT2_9ERIC|nr:putative amidase [Camellia lanceoleosa]